MGLLEVSALEFPKELVTLSLIGNRLEKADELIMKLQYLSLKALWINGNPVADDPDLKNFVDKKTKIEIFNSKFTKHCLGWGLKFAHSGKLSEANDPDNTKTKVLNLDDRNIFEVDIAVLKSFTNLRKLSLKGHSLDSP